jgi:hypothetical protein
LDRPRPLACRGEVSTLGGGTALFEGATPELRLVANEAAS